MGIVKLLEKKWAGSETIDFIVIVGLDTDENVRDMADSIKGRVYLDPDGRVIRKLGGSGVPHWYVLNSDNRVIKDFGGYFTPVEEQVRRLGF